MYTYVLELDDSFFISQTFSDVDYMDCALLFALDYFGVKLVSFHRCKWFGKSLLPID